MLNRKVTYSMASCNRRRLLGAVTVMEVTSVMVEPLLTLSSYPETPVAISKGFLKGNQFSLLIEEPKCSWSDGSLSQSLCSDTQTALLVMADSCSMPVEAESTVFVEILGNDAISASISNSSVVGVSGVTDALN